MSERHTDLASLLESITDCGVVRRERAIFFW